MSDTAVHILYIICYIHIHIQLRPKVSPPGSRISPRKSNRFEKENESSVLSGYLPHENEPYLVVPTIILAEILNSLCILETIFEDFSDKPVFCVFGELGRASYLTKPEKLFKSHKTYLDYKVLLLV